MLILWIKMIDADIKDFRSLTIGLGNMFCSGKRDFVAPLKSL
jgi:hypothetical protein